MKSKLLVFFVLVAFTSACAPHQALIQTDPPGAIVTINGEDVGQTPLYYDYKLSSGKDHTIHINRSGFEEVDMTIKADKTDSKSFKRWLVAGAVWSPLWLGTFFTKKLKESYLFVMKRDQATMTAMLEK